MPNELLINSPGMARLVAQAAALLRQDMELRGIQSQNAPQAKYPDQPAGGVTGVTLYNILQAQNENEKFATAVLFFETASGTGRYRIDGANPTAAGGGIFIPAGAGQLIIPGWNNIARFRLIAETGQTLLFFRYVFI